MIPNATALRHLLIVLAAIAVTPALASERTVVVDIGTAPDAAAVQALKERRDVAWSVEVGDKLLLAGSLTPETARADGLEVLADLGRLSVDELQLHARGCNGDARNGDGPGLPAERIILPVGSYDLVRLPRPFGTRAAQLTVDPAAITTFRDDLGNAEWLPVAANAVLARMRRLDYSPPDTIDDQISRIVGRVDGERWFANVSTLASWDRSSFASELDQARRWIGGKFRNAGLTVEDAWFQLNAYGHSVDIANVIGRVEGVVDPDQWIIVGAHYDSRNAAITSPTPTPGADDNASGCAGVIEIANAIVDQLPQRTVVFICYAGEEQGLHGSHDHVGHLADTGGLARVRAMLNMDMIGWSPDATLGVIAESVPGAGNMELANLLADAALTYAPDLDPAQVIVAGNSCCSDHMPYINAGRPGVLSIHRLRAATPYYHQSSDTPANLGPHARQIGASIVRMNLAALVTLAGVDRILAADNEP